MKLFDSLIGCLIIIRRFISSFILHHVLGWRVLNEHKFYQDYKKGRHVVIYTFTSLYEILIGYLVCMSYNITAITMTRKDIQYIPFFEKILNMISVIHIIFVDNKKNQNATEYVSKELDKYQNFLFAVSPEGKRSMVSEIKSGFYHIAKKTSADINIIKFDFSNQHVSINEIVGKNHVQIYTYDKIKELVENEMKNEIPYYPDKCHLTQDKISVKTSFINFSRSLLIYIPFLTVSYILYTSVFYL